MTTDKNKKTKKKVFTEEINTDKLKQNESDGEAKTGKRHLFLSLFKKTEKVDKKDLNLASFLSLFQFSTKLDKTLMILGSFGSIANGAMLPIMLIIFMNIFDAFTDFGKFCNVTNTSNFSYPLASDLTNQMKDQALYLVYLGLGTHILSYIQVTFWLITSQRQTRLIRKKLFESILRQNVGWFDVYKTGELNNRLSEDINKIRDGIGDKCGNCLQFIATFIIGVIIALVKGWKLTLVVLSVSPLLFAASVLFTKSTATLTNSELTAYARAGSIAQEVFTAIRTVFAFGGAKKEHERYVKNLDDAKFFGIKKGFLNGLLMGFLWFAIFGAYALGFWYGWTLSTEINPATGKSDYSIGKILLVFFSILIGVFSLGNAGPFFGTAASARAAAHEVFEIIERVPPIDASSKEGKTLDSLIGNIEFSNVTFNYPARVDVKILNNININIKSGITCALVGSSGCGKSTCVQLLQRFYDPIGGAVKIDNINLKEFNVNWLRSQIGVVNQEPILFATTIAENIRFGKKDATDEEIQRAAINANAHDFISTLPDKYETLVGDRGGQLSGGQKQRIAIARALIRNPKILLLDEATSALDNESESIVQAALDKARMGRTTVIVAHRLSTIRNADVIFAFDKGVICESGTHEELMKQKGVYYNLVITQETKAITKVDSNEIIEEEDETDLSEDLDAEKTINLTNDIRKKSISSVKFAIPDDSTKKVQEEEDKDEKKEKKSIFAFLKKDKKPKEKKPSMKKVFLLNKPEWGYIIIGCIFSVIAGGIQPGFGIVLSKAVGLFASCSYNDQKEKIQTYCIIFLVFAVASLISYIIQNGMFAVAGEELTKRIRSKAFKAMLQQEIGWFDDNNNGVGVLTTKLAVEAAAVQGATGIRLGFVLMNVSNLGVGIVIAFAFSWPITLLILGFVPFLIMGGVFQTKMLAGFSGHDKKNLEETGKITNESIGNIRTVATLNKEIYFIEKYNQKIDVPHKEGIRTAHLNGFVLGLTTSVLFYAIAAAYTLGAYLIEKNLFGMSLENIMLVFNCVLFGAQSVGQASALLPDYAKAKEAIKSMFELFDRVPSINNWESETNGLKIENKNFDAEITLKQVEFTFPTRKEAKILKGIDLTIKNGQKIALVGSSGCGKSTITQLLERFYDPDAGHITFCDKNLKDFDLHWLRSQIGIVSQEPILFDISIRENIAYGDNTRQVSIEEIISAAQKANIHDFISNLPNGYETNVGSKGTQLSGGQKQRIAIARALIRDPKILLLDEATSALDTESEKLVQDALDKAQEGRTCIIIAHRLSTIKNCDRIFVIKNGKVFETGTHDQLIALNGFYTRLNGQHR